MGLSNEERILKIYAAVNGLNEAVKEHKKFLSYVEDKSNYQFEEIVELIDELWPTLISESGDSLHWLCGSNSSNNTIRNHCFFSAALYYSPPIDSLPFENLNLEPGSFEEFLWENFPDDMRYLVDNKKRFIVDCIRNIEFYFYSINRYKDDFAKNYLPLTNKICKIAGIIHSVVESDQEYYRAWLGQSLMEKIKAYDTDDFVMRFLYKVPIHTVLNYPDPDLYNDFIYYRPVRKLSTEERLIIAFKFLGGVPEYQLEELFKLKDEHPEIDMGLIDSCAEYALELNNKSYEVKKSEDNNKPYWHFCNLTFNSYQTREKSDESV